MPKLMRLFRKARAIRWRSGLVPLAAFVAIACPPVIVANVWLIARAETRTHANGDDAPERTVAIVPGARVYPDGRPSAVLEDRLECARQLYAAGRVRKILVSGDHGRSDYDEPNAMFRWLVDHGVARDDIFLDHAGFRTLDTMARAARVFQVRDAIVCTQAFHLPRALFLAEAAGIDADGVIANRRVYASRRVDAARELLARTRAILDRYVLHTGPRMLGDAIPIDGSPFSSHDARTVAFR